jgi:hypothetical protein
LFLTALGFEEMNQLREEERISARLLVKRLR